MAGAIELIDVLREDGAPAGVCKPKNEIHRDGDWHLSIHVWIVSSDGRVLIQRRSREKDNNPGLWDVSVAGHVSAGESSLSSALREVEEEIGLGLDPSELQFIGRVREAEVLNGGAYLDNEFHDVFLVRRDVDLSTLALQPGEVDEVAWVTPDELRERHDLVPHPEGYALLFRAISD